MVERRSRRPASSRRPRVAGHRKRATQDRDTQHQEQAEQSTEQESGAVADEVTDATADSSAQGDRSDEAARTTEERADAGSEDDADTAEERAEAGSEDGADTPAESDTADEAPREDPTDVGVFGDSDTSEADTRALVVRDGLVEFDVDESATADEAPPAEPQPLPDGESGAEESSGEPATAAPSRRIALIAVLGVLTVLCAALAFWFQHNVRILRDQGPASNEALVDRGTTSEVNGEVSDAIATLFSYDFADTAKTEDAAQELLVGNAVREYDQLFATVKEQAPKQKLVVTTTVKDSGVTSLQDDRARVLLFVDQNASRNGEKGNVIPAQISVGVEKRGGQWKINQIIQR